MARVWLAEPPTPVEVAYLKAKNRLHVTQLADMAELRVIHAQQRLDLAAHFGDTADMDFWSKKLKDLTGDIDHD